MGRLQKATVVISVILVLVLSAALALFLWKESGRESMTTGANAQTTEEGKGPESLLSENEEKPEAKIDRTVGEEADSQEEKIHQEGSEAVRLQEQEALGDGEAGKPVMVFAGDVMPGNMVRNNYISSGLDGILTAYLQEELKQADITILNQEFPFSNRGTPAQDKQYTFRIDPSFISIFTELGVDAVSLANNHALDYGTEALNDTFAVLEQAGIPYAGAGGTKERAAQPVYLNCQGKTVGFLAASRVIPEVSWNVENQQPGMLCTYDSAALTAAIQQARPNCDFLAVYVHWGVEKQEHPEEYQRTLAQAYIDAGADLVVGSHPHVPQGIEYYQGKPIVYSLGNFIFNPDMEGTYVLKVFLQEDGSCQLKLIPVSASQAFTEQLQGQEGAALLSYIEDISYGVSVEEDGTVTEEGAQ